MNDRGRKVSTGCMESLWSGITGKYRQRPDRVNRIISWSGVPMWSLEDYLYDIGAMPTDIDGLMAGIGVQPCTLYSRPKASDREAYGGEGLTLTGMVSLMIRLEYLGLPADPAPLIDVLLPALKKQKLLTQDDLGVYWHGRERYRNLCKLLADGPVGGDVSHVTDSGYRCFLGNNRDNNGVLLVAGPKVTKKRIIAKRYDVGLLGFGDKVA